MGDVLFVMDLIKSVLANSVKWSLLMEKLKSLETLRMDDIQA